MKKFIVLLLALLIISLCLYVFKQKISNSSNVCKNNVSLPNDQKTDSETALNNIDYKEDSDNYNLYESVSEFMIKQNDYIKSIN